MSIHDQDSKDVLSVFEFFEMLPDEQSAIEFIESVRWPDGVICPRCKSARAKKIANQKRYNCNDCRRPVLGAHWNRLREVQNPAQEVAVCSLHAPDGS